MNAIDAWANVRVAGLGWQRQVAAEIFKRPAEEIFKSFGVEETIATMDAAGVDKAILGVNAEMPEKDVLAFAAQQPDRFAFTLHVDPRRGMRAVRAIEALAKSQPVVGVRLVPSLLDLPPDDRVYYPTYAKCAELGLAACVTTGIPGPPLPAEHQQPLLLDRVCLFFPELTLVMANGADPWWSVAIRLLRKHRNLHLMTSAIAPKRLPEELLAFMRRSGRDKILFATDHPFLEMARCVREANELDLPDDVRASFLHGNATRIFFQRGSVST